MDREFHPPFDFLRPSEMRTQVANLLIDEILEKGLHNIDLPENPQTLLDQGRNWLFGRALSVGLGRDPLVEILEVLVQSVDLSLHPRPGYIQHVAAQTTSRRNSFPKQSLVEEAAHWLMCIDCCRVKPAPPVVAGESGKWISTDAIDRWREIKR